MTNGQRYYAAFLCAAFTLISAMLVFWPRKRQEANPIPQARESVAVVGEPTAGTPARKTPVPTVVAETPTAVKLAPVAMVPPPVREAEDATARVETLPRVEDYEAVLVEVSALGDSLPEKQIADLYGFLKRPLQAFKDMDAPSVASLKNQVMDKLLEQQSLPADYGAEMIGLYRNRANDELLRNFAVQHLELYAGTLAVRGGYDAASDQALKIRSALDAASRETDSSIGGAALLGLERLSRLDAKIDRSALATRAAACAANASSDLQTRIAAIQVCGEMRIKTSAATLRALADDPAANTVLRLSARHSLSLLAE